MGNVKVCNVNMFDLPDLLEYSEVDSDLSGKVSYAEVSNYFSAQSERLCFEHRPI